MSIQIKSVERGQIGVAGGGKKVLRKSGLPKVGKPQPITYDSTTELKFFL